jgi:hypothetical protein
VKATSVPVVDTIDDFLKNSIKLKFVIREGYYELLGNDSTEQCGSHTVHHLISIDFGREHI